MVRVLATQDRVVVEPVSFLKKQLKTMFGKENGGRISSEKKSELGVGKQTRKSRSHWSNVDIQNQVLYGWFPIEVLGKDGCKKGIHNSQEGVDYHDTFAPSLRKDTIWTLVAFIEKKVRYCTN